MNSIERFYATIERRPVDRPACWLGFPDVDAIPALFRHFGVRDMRGLKAAVGDDVNTVEPVYRSPQSDAIYAAFDFTRAGLVDSRNRTLTARGFFAGREDPADVELFDWPEPERYMDAAACRAAAESAAGDGKAVLGMLWSAHFQDVCAAFGMEEAMVAMLESPDIVCAVDARIVDFYLRANRIFYEATRGLVHAVLIGNDMGSQNGLMLSARMIRDFVLPGARKLIAQAHAYGLKVIYHSCGSVSEIIPDLIRAGADAIHPIQALAKGMGAQELKQKYGGAASFCGGIDTQRLLVNGTPEQVKAEVRRIRRLFPTGLILSPSHEAILPDVNPANIRALFEAATEVWNEEGYYGA